LSVDDPRHAAAQRTAVKRAGGRVRRVRLLATWLFIVPLLSFFSFSVVAGAKTFGKPNLRDAVSQLPDTRHVIEVTVHRNDDGNHGRPDDGDHAANMNALVDRFSHSEHYVCSVNASQLERIQQRYRTGRITIPFGSHPVDIVEVFNASEPDMRSFLGTQQLHCVLVRIASIFFLPFDPHTS
jgi:hypothetical protein